MDKVHPALCGFEQTFERDFPLVMVVGREPSSDEGIVHGLGEYRMREQPFCAFWNVSHGVAGEQIGLRAGGMKALCYANGASPIVYADALPITIPNAVVKKAPLRAAVTDAAIAEHVAHVFSHEAVIARVRLVLLSGLEPREFKRPVAAYRAACAARGIMAVEIPFFFGNNVPKIRTLLTGPALERLSEIVRAFQAAGQFQTILCQSASLPSRMPMTSL